LIFIKDGEFTDAFERPKSLFSDARAQKVTDTDAVISLKCVHHHL